MIRISWNPIEQLKFSRAESNESVLLHLRVSTNWLANQDLPELSPKEDERWFTILKSNRVTDQEETCGGTIPVFILLSGMNVDAYVDARKCNK